MQHEQWKFGVLRWTWLYLAVAVAALADQPASGQPEPAGPGAGSGTVIVLKNDFIEKYKDLVTVDAMFNVDTVGPIHKVSKGGDDGDMHFSGRGDAIGLPTVAEIMNAKDFHFKKAVAKVKAAAGGDPVKIAGAWRIWCEHANNSKQVQGAKLQPFAVSNPDHVFEIHPVTSFAGIDLLDSIDGIHGNYHYYDATTAFNHYANVTCSIRPGKDGTVTIRTHSAGYNYVEFLLESQEEPASQYVTKNKDGRFLRANVRDTDGELVARDVRMAFIAGTDAEQTVQKLPKNGRVHVAAIPRIDLALVSWRVKHAGDPQHQQDSPLNWNLPYEMIVVGVLREEE
jgi:hypothetical protein